MKLLIQQALTILQVILERKHPVKQDQLAMAKLIQPEQLLQTVPNHLAKPQRVADHHTTLLDKAKAGIVPLLTTERLLKLLKD